MKDKLLFAAFVCLLIWILMGCSATRDRKAKERILGDPKLSEEMFKALEPSHPCVNDTFYRFLPGADVIDYDTIWSNNPVYFYDTMHFYHDVKSKPQIQYITKTIRRTDTVVKNIEDVRRLNLALAENNNLKGQLQSMTVQKNEEKKGKQKYLWLFIAACGVIGLGLFLKVKSAFKPKI